MFLLKRDKFKKLKFAPLFGETYQAKVKMDLLNSPDSIVFSFITNSYWVSNLACRTNALQNDLRSCKNSEKSKYGVLSFLKTFLFLEFSLSFLD
jgi:hypothetical protein